ncbi:MAG: Asp-tRNA(Asn)/Glu-tRNA(Gln) amidotransferase subunit GatC [bacterium JZ-2024 1]
MDPKEFELLLALSHLILPDSEQEIIFRQINEIIEHINRIQSLSLPEIAPYFYPNQSHLELRPDETKPWDFKETLLRNAPATQGPYLVCPPVIPDKPGPSDIPGESGATGASDRL